MFREESLWIKDAISMLPAPAGNNLVANIGSSTDHFRKVLQPHIQANMVDSLQGAGWRLVNVDMKPEPGVDLVADVTKPDFAPAFTNQFGLTLCTNLLEHVADIGLVVKNLVSITQSGGYLLITVPYKYKHHLDPIDNGFRPTPQQIIDLFKDVAETIVASRIISISDIDQYRVKQSHFPLWGYRERLAYYFGKRHKTSGILFSIKK